MRTACSGKKKKQTNIERTKVTLEERGIKRWNFGEACEVKLECRIEKAHMEFCEMSRKVVKAKALVD